MLLAADPAPPADSAATATSALANFGDAALGVFGDLVTNVWVLAIFAFGIAVVFAALVIQRLANKVGFWYPTTDNNHAVRESFLLYDKHDRYSFYDSSKGRVVDAGRFDRRSWERTQHDDLTSADPW